MDAEDLPDFSCTAVLKAHFGGKQAKSWYELSGVAHTFALSHFGNIDTVIERSPAEIVKGSNRSNYFRVFNDLGISIRCPNAKAVWSNVLELAIMLDKNVWVYFEWKLRKKSLYHGRTGRLKWDSLKMRERIAYCVKNGINTEYLMR